MQQAWVKNMLYVIEVGKENQVHYYVEQKCLAYIAMHKIDIRNMYCFAYILLTKILYDVIHYRLHSLFWINAIICKKYNPVSSSWLYFCILLFVSSSTSRMRRGERESEMGERRDTSQSQTNRQVQNTPWKKMNSNTRRKWNSKKETI